MTSCGEALPRLPPCSKCKREESRNGGRIRASSFLSPQFSLNPPWFCPFCQALLRSLISNSSDHAGTAAPIPHDFRIS